MSARKASREPYQLRRSPRELWTAVGVAVAIVLVTVVMVWILAPSDESPASDSNPVLTLPADTTPTTPASTTDTTLAPTDTTPTSGG
jgi:hypothetical protein